MPKISFYFICFATIMAFLKYNKFKKSKYQYFSLYIGFIFILETLSLKFFNFNNLPFYNTLIILSFLFYFYFYKNIFRIKKSQRLMSIFSILFILFGLFDLIILKNNFLNNFLNNTLVFGSFLLIITIIVFLIEIVKNEDIVFNIKKSFIFWVSIGILLFYIGIFPIMITINYLKYGSYQIYDLVITILNFIMYSCIIIGYLYSDPKYNY